MNRELTIKSLFTLTRLGIGNHSDGFIGEQNDWPAVQTLAREQGLAAIAFTNVSTCFSEVISNLRHPVQFAIGAGAMLAYQGFKTVRASQDLRRHNKMSYLLSIEEELGAR